MGQLYDIGITPHRQLIYGKYTYWPKAPPVHTTHARVCTLPVMAVLAIDRAGPRRPATDARAVRAHRTPDPARSPTFSHPSDRTKTLSICLYWLKRSNCSDWLVLCTPFYDILKCRVHWAFSYLCSIWFIAMSITTPFKLKTELFNKMAWKKYIIERNKSFYLLPLRW